MNYDDLKDPAKAEAAVRELCDKLRAIDALCRLHQDQPVAAEIVALLADSRGFLPLARRLGFLDWLAEDECPFGHPLMVAQWESGAADGRDDYLRLCGGDKKAVRAA
jgi:hypothetical protein